MEYLDEDVWRPTSLGVVGPVGLLSAAAVGTDSMVYASLPTHALEEPSVPKSLTDRRVVLDGRERIVSRFASVLAEVPALETRSLTTPDSDWLLLGIRRSNESDDLACYMIVQPRYEDPRQAHLFHWWSERSLDDSYQATVTLWSMVQHELAKRGFTAAVTQYTSDALRNRYTSTYSIFESPRQSVDARGLASYVKEAQ